jgi:uncharacterized membrane protein YphA (DoxX/SURF4 family)
MNPAGRHVYGLGAVALGLLGLVWGDFALQWQPVPAALPGRTELAYVFAAALLLAGLATNGRRRTAAPGAATLCGLYSLVVVLLHGPIAFAHPLEFSSWSGVGEQLALASGGLVAYASSAEASAQSSNRLRLIGTRAFGVCLLVFGLAHFKYLDFTAGLVPRWLPGSQLFWAAATGVAHIAAGIAILSGLKARLAAILLTIMFASFSVLIHAPLLFASPASHLNWVMNAMNLALTGAAWVVADSLGWRNKSAAP